MGEPEGESRGPRVRGAGRASALLGSVVVFLAAFALLVTLFRGVIQSYVPAGDEFSLIVHSTSFAEPVRPASWFTSGFSRYFRPYPEFSGPYTNFLRPVVNLVYFLNWKLWNTEWRAALLFNYALLAACAAFAEWFTGAGLGGSRPASLAAGAAVLLNPATSRAVLLPAFAFDALAALFVGAAFVAVGRRNWLASVGLLTVAMFTKESVVFAPFAAAVTWSFDRRGDPAEGGGARRCSEAAALMLLPLGLWGLARHLAFGRVFGGEYVRLGTAFESNLEATGEFLRRWPLGIEHPVTLSFLSGEGGPLGGSPWSVVFAGLSFLNLALWGFLAVVAFRVWPRRKAMRLDSTPAVVLVWLLAAWAVLFLLRLEIRFGFFCFLVGVPLLSWRLFEVDARTRGGKVAAALLVLSVALPGVRFLAEVRTESWQRQHALRARLAASLVGEIGRAGATHRRVFLANDVTAGHSSWVGSFSKSKAPVVTLLTVRTGARLDGGESTVVASREAGLSVLTCEVSGDFRYYFPGADAANLERSSRGHGSELVRNESISYQREGREQGRRAWQWDQEQRVVIRLAGAEGDALVFYDSAQGRYRTVDL